MATRRPATKTPRADTAALPLQPGSWVLLTPLQTVAWVLFRDLKSMPTHGNCGPGDFKTLSQECESRLKAQQAHRTPHLSNVSAALAGLVDAVNSGQLGALRLRAGVPAPTCLQDVDAMSAKAAVSVLKTALTGRRSKQLQHIRFSLSEIGFKWPGPAILEPRPRRFGIAGENDAELVQQKSRAAWPPPAPPILDFRHMSANQAYPLQDCVAVLLDVEPQAAARSPSLRVEFENVFQSARREIAAGKLAATERARRHKRGSTEETAVEWTGPFVYWGAFLGWASQAAFRDIPRLDDWLRRLSAVLVVPSPSISDPRDAPLSASQTHAVQDSGDAAAQAEIDATLRNPAVRLKTIFNIARGVPRADWSLDEVWSPRWDVIADAIDRVELRVSGTDPRLRIRTVRLDDLWNFLTLRKDDPGWSWMVPVCHRWAKQRGLSLADRLEASGHTAEKRGDTDRRRQGLQAAAEELWKETPTATKRVVAKKLSERGFTNLKPGQTGNRSSTLSAETIERLIRRRS